MSFSSTVFGRFDLTDPFGHTEVTTMAITDRTAVATLTIEDPDEFTQELAELVDFLADRVPRIAQFALARMRFDGEVVDSPVHTYWSAVASVLDVRDDDDLLDLSVLPEVQTAGTTTESEALEASADAFLGRHAPQPSDPASATDATGAAGDVPLQELADEIEPLELDELEGFLAALRVTAVEFVVAGEALDLVIDFAIPQAHLDEVLRVAFDSDGNQNGPVQLR